MSPRERIALFAALGRATLLGACPRYAPTDSETGNLGGGASAHAPAQGREIARAQC